ncbi:ELMO domain-containing protein 1-like isoform X2 [Littorina saxatilis]|uniref:ELMO domain-containing protein n=1 Tax=Littorina saxatilis TaxID=31220 RepID=A0AAN9B266_9CAEN
MVFSELIASLWTQLLVLLRPMLKWILRKVTGKCQLLRITYEEQPGSKQTKRIEKSLRESKSSALKELSRGDRVDVDEAVKNVIHQKDIVVDIHTKFEETLRRCLTYISGFNNLEALVEGHRKVKYSTANPEHEAKLLKLWELYKPGTKLQSRQCAQWGELGFQGNDPATDFRGMGMLGLDQLLYFAEKYGDEALNALSKSSHPKHGFSFAIVGINITELQYTLMTKRKLRTHFYNLHNPRPSMDAYHEVYCYLMSEFTKFWFKEKPKDIMEFSRIREKFRRHIISLLKDPKTTLKTDFQQQ